MSRPLFRRSVVSWIYIIHIYNLNRRSISLSLARDTRVRSARDATCHEHIRERERNRDRGCRGRERGSLIREREIGAIIQSSRRPQIAHRDRARTYLFPSPVHLLPLASPPRSRCTYGRDGLTIGTTQNQYPECVGSDGFMTVKGVQIAPANFGVRIISGEILRHVAVPRGGKRRFEVFDSPRAGDRAWCDVIVVIARRASFSRNKLASSNVRVAQK